MCWGCLRCRLTRSGQKRLQRERERSCHVLKRSCQESRYISTYVILRYPLNRKPLCGQNMLAMHGGGLQRGGKEIQKRAQERLQREPGITCEEERRGQMWPVAPPSLPCFSSHFSTQLVVWKNPRVPKEPFPYSYPDYVFVGRIEYYRDVLKKQQPTLLMSHPSSLIAPPPLSL